MDLSGEGTFVRVINVFVVCLDVRDAIGDVAIVQRHKAFFKSPASSIHTQLRMISTYFSLHLEAYLAGVFTHDLSAIRKRPVL
jgi:hypothetical protein